MRQQLHIQKCLAFLLLVLFAAGSAPKAYFHDLVADHKDVASCDQLHKSAVLHTQGFNCHCEDLVITSPFVSPALVTALTLPSEVPEKNYPAYQSSHQLFVQHKDSRGPPRA